MTRKTNSKPTVPTIRCAIYTRKSTDEGLDQEFNSLDAQRESGEAYIASQRGAGWVCVPEHYDDGGFSGGNMERPALKRLLADIDAGKVDCVVVYKVDRLSRSLLDFAKIMEVFEQRKVSFVSVTQQFNTATSMGRLVLNVLLSFAQFEREIIGERIRDKIAAQRRRGKWTGGTPVLGYDVDRSGPSPKLAVNAAEAAHVREIFNLYLAQGSLLPVVEELVRRGWLNKAWKTKTGRPKGGQPFDRGTLHALLTNPLYAGKLRHKTNLYDGEHERIIEPDVFQKVQAQLQQNNRCGGVEVRNRYGALLKRLLYCKACGHTMVHNFTGRNGRRYRYYTCTHAIKSGRAACPSPNLPAAEVEKLVVDRIRCIARDQTLRTEVLRQARTLVAANLENLRTESDGLKRDLARYHAELQKLTADGPVRGVKADRIADLQCLIAQAETRLAEVRAQIQKQDDERVEEHDILAAFADFDGMWNTLSPREQAQVLTLLVERVEFDAATSEILISFHPSAIKTLAQEQRGESV
jgi:site-specific DNA recombinase